MSHELKKLRAPIAALATFTVLVWGGVLTKTLVLDKKGESATKVAAAPAERRPRASSSTSSASSSAVKRASTKSSEHLGDAARGTRG